MNPSTAKPVAIGLRLYRALAAAFPYEFRAVYGDELMLTTEEAIDDVWRRRGLWGLARLLLDIAVRVPAEHAVELWQDIRYGLRSLRSSPGFTAVALLSLALGIGVASSAFSEMNGFILRDVPAVKQPGEMALLLEPVSYPSYQLYRQRNDLFTNSFAFLAPVPFGVAFGGHTERIWGHIVTPSYFPTLGVAPALGRFFAEQEPAGGVPSVVVSYRFWQIEMGADRVNVGFDPKNVFLVSLDPVRDGYSGPQAAVLFDRILDRVQRLPFVTSATLTSHSPMEGIGYPVAALSTTEPGNNGARTVHVARRFFVGRGYFETVGIGILAGRAFLKEDETREPRPVIVSETLSRYLWDGRSPIGRIIEMGGDAAVGFSMGGSGGNSPALKAMEQFEVVGMARNVRDGLESIEKTAYPAIYLPLRPADYARPQMHGLTLMVRAQPGVDALTAMRREIASVDSQLTPFRARTMVDQIDDIMSVVNAASTTYATIGIFGLILASVGLAGVTAYSVARRGREIGIRMALGARRADVLGLVMREGAALVVVGTAFGMAGAWAGMRGLSGIMAEVARVAGSSTSDPVLLVGGPLLLGALAMVACYLPARKSMRIDPAITLRQE